ncbi:MAG TPA: VWA domain-containing protein [Saprospiraceae bacterium]|nr:VWA domain-containing protein [Saprospiraceae bacterium]HMQ83767.1 VWA domain-containing protein [Saprospiraceae bacterium]
MRKLFFLLLASCCWLGFALAQPTSKNVLIVLDASGSMWGKMGNSTKIAVARTALSDLLDQLPNDTQLGLIAYGHRQKGDCNDIEWLFPFGQLDKTAVIAKVNALNPVGKTPITSSLKMALESVKSTGNNTTIILVSDGLETCDADPCQAVQVAYDQQLPFVLHVIGFGLEEESAAQLECIAQAGEGQYFDVKEADQLIQALDQAVDTPVDMEGGYFSIKGLANGKLVDLSVHVIKDKKMFTGSRTYTSPETNPRVMKLPAGKYQVKVNVVGVKAKLEDIFDIDIVTNDTLFKVMDYTTGILAVKVTRNGALSDATVNAYKPGSTTYVSGTRSYREAAHNPTKIVLAAGEYDVRVKSVEIEGAEEVVFEKITIKGDETTALEVPWESGTLKVGASNSTGYVDATVNVFKKSNPRASIAAGRTYMSDSSNPKSFTLAPGSYIVKVKPVKPAGLAEKTIEVEITKEVTTEHLLKW